MPTKKQLYQRWASEMNFSQPDEDGYNVRGSSMASQPNTIKEFTGEIIGHYKWDEESQDFKLVLNSEHKDERSVATEAE